MHGQARELRQGRKAATVVCFASAAVTLALFSVFSCEFLVLSSQPSQLKIKHLKLKT